MIETAREEDVGLVIQLLKDCASAAAATGQGVLQSTACTYLAKIREEQDDDGDGCTPTLSTQAEEYYETALASWYVCLYVCIQMLIDD